MRHLLFPTLPERSVLHKRTKSLGLVLDRCRCALRDGLVDPHDDRRLLDGTPVPVCDLSRVARPDAGHPCQSPSSSFARYLQRRSRNSVKA